MFEIKFYADESGYSETAEWIREMDRRASGSKEHRVRLKKIYEYIECLASYGTRIGMPMVRHLTGTELWELRPTRDRVIFAYVENNTFLLLNHFMKKTEKTPPKEIEKAKRMLNDYLKRSELL